jgi:FKBP-type peptidyl-prolyl cis-trans isomerase
MNLKNSASAMALAFLTLGCSHQSQVTNTTPMSQSNPSDNLAKGQAFLKQNSTQPGVKTTPSGLQYKVITEGTGKSPAATDTVLVHYRGTTIDGVEFDSSYKRNEPISFPLNGVIPGWTEGVQLMKEGGKIQLFIPSNLAYGSRGAGGVIAPDSTLIFDIELLKVQ